MALVYNAAEHAYLLPSFAQVHADCITIDGTIATFLPPLDHRQMAQWWRKQTESPSRITIMTLNEAKDECTGIVMLEMPRTQTGPFRGIVQKLLVSPRHRQKGLARQLMTKLEEVALQQEITSLMLDTVKDSPAEFVYPRFGYNKLGEIPDYGICPIDGSLKGAVVFWKNLPGHGQGYPRGRGQ